MTDRSTERLALFSEKMYDILKDVNGVLKNSEVRSGVCMCGESMSGHKATENHTPLDMGKYHSGIVLYNINQLENELDRLEGL